jgi:site-specific recombinase XerD
VKTPNYLTTVEVDQLLKTALAGRYGVRDVLLISFLYHHCMSVSEIVALKISDIERGRIRIRRKKGGFPNEHRLLTASGKPWRDEERLLCRYLLWRTTRFNAASERLFLGQKGTLTRQQVYNIVRNTAIGSAICGNNSTPRLLKSSGIFHLIQRGIPLLHAQSYGGGKMATQNCFVRGVSAEQVNRAACAAFARPKSPAKRPQPVRLPPKRKHMAAN